MNYFFIIKSFRHVYFEPKELSASYRTNEAGELANVVSCCIPEDQNLCPNVPVVRDEMEMKPKHKRCKGQ